MTLEISFIYACVQGKNFDLKKPVSDVMDLQLQ